MARDTANAKDRNRRIRQEALREQLEGQGHVQHVIEIAQKLLDGHLSLEAQAIAALKAAADIKLKLIAKYIPDLKATEISGEIDHKHKHSIVSAEAQSVLDELTGRGKGPSDSVSRPH